MKRRAYKRVVILGAGPTGLGAAYRLKQIGHKYWSLYEQQGRIGGLSATHKDKRGFLWDIGGHVMFSYNERFNNLADALMGKDFIHHERESWICIMDRWIPYPFQNNIHSLPEYLTKECLAGLFRAQRARKRVCNFEDWIIKNFGQAIARVFMLPYNSKMWAVPLRTMSYEWIGERVSVVDVEKVKRNVEQKRDDVAWGPNNQFRFPRYGGTGSFFNKFEPFVKGKLYCGEKACRIDIDSRTVYFSSRHKDNYDILINTTPLDIFIKMLTTKKVDIGTLQNKAGHLKHNSIYVVGIGLKKKIPGTKCWVYFPEADKPFYRMTYFSFYSPHNVPGADTDTYSSLICEVSFSEYKTVDEKDVVELTIKGLIKAGILSQKDTALIITTFLKKIDYAYPIPTIGRNDILKLIQAFLEQNAIYSRGRFGAWKYEIGNMDHSTMMGIELIDRLFLGEQEKIWRA